MLLRRIIKHVTDQNWTAVGLDFFIVVVGVFIGIQVSNWNAGHANERTYQDARQRLAEEAVEMLQDADQVEMIINDMLSDVQQAIDVLKECKADTDAEAKLDVGLNTIRSSRGMGANTLTIDQLVEDDRLLERQSDNERIALRRYHTGLHNINDTAIFIMDNFSAKQDLHPLIGFTDLLTPEESFNGTDIRRAEINVPPSEACKDHTFIKLFYNWERAHNYQLKLIEDLRTIIADNEQLLNNEGGRGWE